MTAEKVEMISDEDMPMFDMFTNRFSKLQDFMGDKLFTALLIKKGEYKEEMGFVHKLNMLEKLHLIEEATQWKDMRTLRNHLAHEYPDYPEIKADFLNLTRVMSTLLLQCLDNIVKQNLRI